MVNWITNTILFFICFSFLGVVDIQVKYRNCVLCIGEIKSDGSSGLPQLMAALEKAYSMQMIMPIGEITLT